MKYSNAKRIPTIQNDNKYSTTKSTTITKKSLYKIYFSRKKIFSSLVMKNSIISPHRSKTFQAGIIQVLENCYIYHNIKEEGSTVKIFIFSICLLAIISANSFSMAEEVTAKKISYGGWDNCILMTNGTVDLIATTDVGPRIIFYGFTGKENEFFEVKDNLGKTSQKEWLPFGGHRLWIAPEEVPKTYFPDSGPISFEIKNNTLYLTEPIETNGIKKEMEITMDKTGTHVNILHRLTNTNENSMELAPWSITQMETGGTAIVPQEKYVPHPDSAEGKKLGVSTSSYLPVRTIALWSYTDMTDTRYTFTKNYIIIKQDISSTSPTKIGMSNKEGWSSYIRNGHLFIKTSPFKEGGIYPDKGSSFEVFTNQDMLELETMSPLVTLSKGEQSEHTENWYLFDNIKVDENDGSINEQVLTKVQSVLK